MQLSQLVSLFLAAASVSTAAAAVLDTRGGIPCGYSNPSDFEPCPPQWPTCVKFPSSCTSNCAGLCV